MESYPYCTVLRYSRGMTPHTHHLLLSSREEVNRLVLLPGKRKKGEGWEHGTTGHSSPMSSLAGMVPAPPIPHSEKDDVGLPVGDLTPECPGRTVGHSLGSWRPRHLNGRADTPPPSGVSDIDGGREGDRRAGGSTPGIAHRPINYGLKPHGQGHDTRREALSDRTDSTIAGGDGFRRSPDLTCTSKRGGCVEVFRLSI